MSRNQWCHHSFLRCETERGIHGCLLVCAGKATPQTPDYDDRRQSKHVGLRNSMRHMLKQLRIWQVTAILYAGTRHRRMVWPVKMHNSEKSRHIGRSVCLRIHWWLVLIILSASCFESFEITTVHNHYCVLVFNDCIVNVFRQSMNGSGVSTAIAEFQFEQTPIS